MKFKRLVILFPLILLLAGCTSLRLPGAVEPTPTLLPLPGTGTPCGCTLNETPEASPTGGISAAGPGAPVEASPTAADLQSLKDRWEPFTNETYGFTFEVPAAYGQGQYGFCAAREVPAPDPASAAIFHVALGSRTELTLLPAQGKSLADLAQEYQAEVTGRDAQAQLDPAQERQVGGAAALSIPYRSGGTGRFAETTLFVKDDVLYRVETGTPSACDVTELNLREMDAYSHLLESFRFTR
jgi:hypothetical protein